MVKYATKNAKTNDTKYKNYIFKILNIQNIIMSIAKQTYLILKKKKKNYLCEEREL